MGNLVLIRAVLKEVTQGTGTEEVGIIVDDLIA